MDAVSKIIVTQSPLQVAGVEGVVIPAKSRGHVLRMLDGNCALVRWEVSCPRNIVNSDHIFMNSFLILILHQLMDAGFRFSDNYLTSSIFFYSPLRPFFLLLSPHAFSLSSFPFPF